MSFILHYKNGKKVQSKMLYERIAPCPSYACEDGKTFCVGELYSGTYEEVAALDWKRNPHVLNGIEGDIAVARADDYECSFAVDLCGIDNLFYCKRKDEFLLSDNIWDIARAIQPEFGDLNQDFIKKNILTMVNDGSTFLKGVRILLPGYCGRYDARSDELVTKEYMDYHHANTILTVDAAVASMDAALNRMFCLMKKKWGDTVFGLGLSGGLDSRVVPHYAKKYGLRLTTYNFCTKRPHKVLLGSSCKSAQKLARAFDVPLKLINWSPKRFAPNGILRVKNDPIGMQRNEFKYDPNGLPDFDVLLGGGYGGLMGTHYPLNVLELNKQELLQVMENDLFGQVAATPTIWSRGLRAFRYIFPNITPPLHAVSRACIAEELFNHTADECRKELADYIESKYGTYSNLEIMESYQLRIICMRERYGALQTHIAQKRSILLYMPFIIKEILKWHPSLSPQKIVLKKLIAQKIPEAANINTDSYTAAPAKASKAISRLCSILNRVIRGNGTAIDELNWHKRPVQQAIRTTMNNECTWFYRILDVRKDRKKIFRKRQMRLAVAIWEMKNLVDFIERKGYMT